jgi:hypothetical protein
VSVRVLRVFAHQAAEPAVDFLFLKPGDALLSERGIDVLCYALPCIIGRVRAFPRLEVV